MTTQSQSEISEESQNLSELEAPDLWQRLELRLQPGPGADGLWPRLDDRLYAAETYPMLRQDLELTPVQGREEIFLLSDRLEGRHFRLGCREAYIVSLLDGQHELEEIVVACSDRFGQIPIRLVEDFLQDLRGAGLLSEAGGIWRRLERQRRRRSAVLWTMPQAEKRLVSLYHRLRFLFHPAAWVVAAAALGATITLLAVRQDLLRADLAYLASWRLVALLLFTGYLFVLPVILSHELTHALACIHFGGRVPRLGLMIRHLLPAAFADVSDVWTLPRRARIAVFLAGPASTALWAGLAALLWVLTPTASPLHLLGLAVMGGSLYSILVGLNPLGGYDGSELLAELLGVPALHERSMQQLWGVLRGRPAPRATSRERRILWSYGIAALLSNAAVLCLIVAGIWHILLR